jgi:hypothetical protein
MKTDVFDNNTNSIYPSEFVSPEVKKTKEYGLAFFKAVHSEWLLNGAFLLRGKQSDMFRNRLYADGSQSQDIYKNLLNVKKNKSWININWEIVDIIPKYLDIMTGYFMRITERVTADAIDPAAQDVKNQEKALLQAKLILSKELKEWSQMMGQNTDPTKSDKFQPQTQDEIDLYMRYGYKLPEEADMELTLSLINWLNDLDTEVKRQFIWSMLVDGEGGVKRYRDRFGKIKYRVVDMLEAIVGYSTRRDRKDMDKGGEYITMTIGEIRKMTDQFTEDDFRGMANLYAGQFGNFTLERYNKDSKYGDFPYDSMRVRVMDLQFRTTNTYKFQRGKRANGTTAIKQIGFNDKGAKDNEKIVKNAVVWMQGFWVVGSNDLMWDYQILEKQIRGDVVTPVEFAKQNLSEAYSEFHFYKPYKKSMTQRMIPHADAIQITSLQLQNAVARSRNKGLAMEIGGLEEISDGQGGKFTPLQIRAIYDQTGDYIWRRKDVDDPSSAPNVEPFKELQGGIGNKLVECVDAINHHLQMIGFVTGVSEIMDASLPNPRQPVGTAEMSAKQTSNILSNIYAGWMSVKENLMQCTGQMLQDDIKDGTVHEGYMSAVGNDLMTYVRANSDISIYNMGIRIWPNPSDQELQYLQQMVNDAVKVRESSGSGGIEVEDAFAINELMKTSIHAAESLLIMRRAQRRREDMQQQQAMAQQKGQVDEQTSKVAMQNAIAIDTAKTKNKMAYDDNHTKNQIQINEGVHQQDMVKTTQEALNKSNHIAEEGIANVVAKNPDIIESTKEPKK